MTITTAPNALRAIFDSEETDFIVKAKKKYSNKQLIKFSFFAIFWNAIVYFAMLNKAPFYKDLLLHFRIEKMTSIFTSNDSRQIFLLLFFLLFYLIGIVLIFLIVYAYFIPGAYYKATPSRLIQYEKNKITIKNWSLFNEKVLVKNNGLVGVISFKLCTGRYIKSSDNSSSRGTFKHDEIHIVGIENASIIVEKCKRRIKEHRDKNTDKAYVQDTNKASTFFSKPKTQKTKTQ